MSPDPQSDSLERCEPLNATPCTMSVLGPRQPSVSRVSNSPADAVPVPSAA